MNQEQYKNKPYVKAEGEFPKTGWYPNPYENRRARRHAKYKKSRLGSKGCYAGVVISPYGTEVLGYHHVLQPITTFDEVSRKVRVVKWISHYIPKSNIC